MVSKAVHAYQTIPEGGSVVSTAVHVYQAITEGGSVVSTAAHVYQAIPEGGSVVSTAVHVQYTRQSLKGALWSLQLYMYSMPGNP